jgi:hypothetical protein
MAVLLKFIDQQDETVVTLSVENILVHDSAKLGSSYGPLPLLQCTVDAVSELVLFAVFTDSECDGRPPCNRQ